MPEGSTLEVKQAKSKFGWGGRYSAWAFDTVLDQTFPYFFNQGFCVNEFKWQVVEKTEGVRDYTNGDIVRMNISCTVIGLWSFFPDATIPIFEINDEN